MSEQINTTATKVIVFELGNKEYALPIQYIRGIEKVSHITRVPNVEPYIKGVINLRGIIIPIIDMRARFGFEPRDMDEHTRVIILAINDLELGFIVDVANDVVDIPLNHFESTTDVVGVKESVFIKNVAKVNNRLLNVLDIEELIKK